MRIVIYGLIDKRLGIKTMLGKKIGLKLAQKKQIVEGRRRRRANHLCIMLYISYIILLFIKTFIIYLHFLYYNMSVLCTGRLIY